jgi:hypothetical protein
MPRTTSPTKHSPSPPEKRNSNVARTSLVSQPCSDDRIRASGRPAQRSPRLPLHAVLKTTAKERGSACFASPALSSILEVISAVRFDNANFAPTEAAEAREPVAPRVFPRKPLRAPQRRFTARFRGVSVPPPGEGPPGNAPARGARFYAGRARAEVLRAKPWLGTAASATARCCKR